MADDVTAPLGVGHLCLGVPLVLLGASALLEWDGVPTPAAVPAGWRYYDMYESLYRIMPVLGVGSLFVGVLNAGFVGWIVYRKTRTETPAAKPQIDGGNHD